MLGINQFILFSVFLIYSLLFSKALYFLFFFLTHFLKIFCTSFSHNGGPALNNYQFHNIRGITSVMQDMLLCSRLY